MRSALSWSSGARIRTLRIGAEVEAARADGSIDHAMDARGEPLGAFTAC